MIDMTSEGINWFETVSNLQTGEVIQEITITSKNKLDKAFLQHIHDLIKQYNREMYKNNIMQTIRESAEKQKTESLINLPLELYIYQELIKKGYIKTYDKYEADRGEIE